MIVKDVIGKVEGIYIVICDVVFFFDSCELVVCVWYFVGMVVYKL